MKGLSGGIDIKKSHLIFDLDGLLVHTGGLGTQIFVNLAQSKKFVKKESDLRGMLLGRSAYDAFLDLCDGDPDQALDLTVQYEVQYLRALKNPGAVKCIEDGRRLIVKALQMGRTVGILTGTSMAEYEIKQEAIPDLSKIEDRFVITRTNLKSGKGKPDPSGVHEMISEMQVQKNEVAMFEDSHAGTLAMMNAGIEGVVRPHAERNRQKIEAMLQLESSHQIIMVKSLDEVSLVD